MADRVHLDSAIRQLVAQHGSLRAAAKAAGLSVTYLSRLASGDQANPSDDTLARLGLQRVIYYTARKESSHG